MSIRDWIAEAGRQIALITLLGQEHCTVDPHAHDLANLPCDRCGAAL